MAAIWLDMLDELLLTRLARSALDMPLPKLARCWWFMVAATTVEVELDAADTRLLCIDDCCCVATVVPGTEAAGFCSKLEGTSVGVVTELGWGRLPFVTFVEGEGPHVVDTETDVGTWEESDELICTSEVDVAQEVGVDAGGGRGTLLPATVAEAEVGGNWFWRPNGDAADWDKQKGKTMLASYFNENSLAASRQNLEQH